MKWVMDGLWGTSNAKRTKRVFEVEVELQSRKKRVSVAMNDVETALSRLREVTRTDSTNLSPRNLKHDTPPPEITEVLDAATAEDQIVMKADLNEPEPDLMEIGEEGDSNDECEYVTAQESDIVKVEDEADIEKLLSAFEGTHPERPTSSVKSESPEPPKPYESYELSESEEFDEGWSSNDHLTDEIDSDEMEESEEKSDMELARSDDDEQSDFDIAWDTPDTSNKDESEDENRKDYNSLVRDRTSFESYVDGGNGDHEEESKKAAINWGTNEKESASNERVTYEPIRKKDEGAQSAQSVDIDVSHDYKCNERRSLPYYGTPEIEIEVANPEP